MQGKLEVSLQDLKCKCVINVTDGKILGNIIDVIFTPLNGKILGFLVPGAKKSWFKCPENIFIPYNCVCKIGIDVILVELFVDCNNNSNCKNNCNNLIGVLNEEENLDENKIQIVDPKIYPN